ncbi:sodium-dependent transporter [Streptomyces sp. NBC_01296]|uniref:sodium-dependent transporter n=1 Tax=Streptomyces sp. NBC_01296 TaxID=2903816 RepID=UPI002E127C8D|nr:sodium-dependent transporter [Streptomyces sp. NBC_01296]
MSPATKPSASRGLAGRLRERLGWAVAAAYLAAAVCPAPGMWLRRPRELHAGNVAVSLELAPALLALVLFCAGLQVPPQTLVRAVRRPATLLAGLAAHLLAPLLIIPALAAMLSWTPDTDGGAGMTTAMIFLTAMPVAAGATVWTARADGDQPTMLGLVLASTFLSPLTLPLTLGAVAPLVGGDHPGTPAGAARAVGQGFALTGVLLPCAAGLLCHIALPAEALAGLRRTAAPTAVLASLALTYLNAAGALGRFLAHPAALLSIAAVAVAVFVCTLSFSFGRVAGSLLRLDTRARACVTLACGMSNSSAGAVLIGAVLPDRPHVLLPVLVYGLLQKLAAQRAVRPPRWRARTVWRDWPGHWARCRQPTVSNSPDLHRC